MAPKDDFEGGGELLEKTTTGAPSSRYSSDVDLAEKQEGNVEGQLADPDHVSLPPLPSGLPPSNTVLICPGATCPIQPSEIRRV
jgi:hypothetical protein